MQHRHAGKARRQCTQLRHAAKARSKCTHAKTLITNFTCTQPRHAVKARSKGSCSKACSQRAHSQACSPARAQHVLGAARNFYTLDNSITKQSHSIHSNHFAFETVLLDPLASSLASLLSSASPCNHYLNGDTLLLSERIQTLHAAPLIRLCKVQQLSRFGFHCSLSCRVLARYLSCASALLTRF
jgi:hypothetical protein